MKRTRRNRLGAMCLMCLGVLACGVSLSAAPQNLTLANAHIRATFEKADGAWRLTELARSDGTDALALRSDEFEVLLFDGTRATVEDYTPSATPFHGRDAGGETVRIEYRPHASASPSLPPAVTVRYTLGPGPYLRKTVRLTVRPGERIDRLQVLRFSADAKASRGGLGEPVFVGNWFFGADYPGFYSRHSDGFVEPDYFYRVPYTIDLEGGDREYAPRRGLVTVFHFLPPARRAPDGTWSILSRTAVMGLSRRPGDPAELALLDYIAETRKPTRSCLQFNNWFSSAAKTLSIEQFVHGTCRAIQQHLAPYGVGLDAMVPDHGWENSKTFGRIFEPKADSRWDPLPRIAEALEKEGTHLGIWLAPDGTNQNIRRGLERGYRSAYTPDFDRSAAKWHSGKSYFDILQPKYQQDLRASVHWLLTAAKVVYIKHDFNHNFTAHVRPQRHARQRCLDAMLDLLAYERRLNPAVFQNYTNGTWFSPWWLQHVDCIWMMSGDAGGGGTWPELSLRAGATTYRDKYFYQNFGNPARCPRPVIPIANFMTHGILFTKRKPFTDGTDTLRDWADYVVMYFARGTTLKELYLDPELLSDAQWAVLGRAARWAVTNQRRLMNTVYIGGDPDQGRAYGYVSWLDGRAILTLRNPARRPQAVRVPFDRSVYYRGPAGRAYRARAVYPFAEPMPWRLTSGRAFEVTVPAESVCVYELEPGEPLSRQAVEPPPLPAARAALDPNAFRITLPVPDEAMARCDLLVQAGAPVSAHLLVNGQPTPPTRSNIGKRWALHAWDLRPHRGRTLNITGRLTAPADAERLRADRKINLDIRLVADRPVRPADSLPAAENLPPPVSRGFRRVSRTLLEQGRITVGIAAPGTGRQGAPARSGGRPAGRSRP